VERDKASPLIGGGKKDMNSDWLKRDEDIITVWSKSVRHYF
jgi:hypothetical protein